jgi:hypothetical protein
MLGSLGIKSTSVFAAETNTVTVTPSETRENQPSNENAYEEKFRKANEKWNTLSQNQKNEVYSLMELRLNTDLKTIDKLAELGVIQKEDADQLKAYKLSEFQKVKQKGVLPLLYRSNQKRRK